jgi:hypothetical protein
MDKKPGLISLTIFAFFITAVFAGSSLAADTTKTIVGVVTEGYQIITDDDEAYDIVENEIGDKIFENAGKKVKATGKVEYDEDTDTRTINVESFTVIEEVEPAEETETDPEMGIEVESETDFEMEDVE